MSSMRKSVLQSYEDMLVELAPIAKASRKNVDLLRKDNTYQANLAEKNALIERETKALAELKSSTSTPPLSLLQESQLARQKRYDEKNSALQKEVNLTNTQLQTLKKNLTNKFPKNSLEIFNLWDKIRTLDAIMKSKGLPKDTYLKADAKINEWRSAVADLVGPMLSTEQQYKRLITDLTIAENKLAELGSPIISQDEKNKLIEQNASFLKNLNSFNKDFKQDIEHLTNQIERHERLVDEQKHIVAFIENLNNPKPLTPDTTSSQFFLDILGQITIELSRRNLLKNSASALNNDGTYNAHLEPIVNSFQNTLTDIVKHKSAEISQKADPHTNLMLLKEITHLTQMSRFFSGKKNAL